MKCFKCHKEGAIFNFPEEDNLDSDKVVYLCLSCAGERLSSMETTLFMAPSLELKPKEEAKVNLQKKIKANAGKVKSFTKKTVKKSVAKSTIKKQKKLHCVAGKQSGIFHSPEKSSEAISELVEKPHSPELIVEANRNRKEIQNSIRSVLRNHPKLKCSGCGYSIKEFQKTGIIKCSACYSSFEILLLPVLEHFHGYNSYHRNKPSDL